MIVTLSLFLTTCGVALCAALAFTLDKISAACFHVEEATPIAIRREDARLEAE